jgi:hypothetical protein
MPETESIRLGEHLVGVRQRNPTKLHILTTDVSHPAWPAWPRDRDPIYSPSWSVSRAARRTTALPVPWWVSLRSTHPIITGYPEKVGSLKEVVVLRTQYSEAVMKPRTFEPKGSKPEAQARVCPSPTRRRGRADRCEIGVLVLGLAPCPWTLALPRLRFGLGQTLACASGLEILSQPISTQY